MSANKMQILPIPCTLGTLPWQPFLALYIRAVHWRHLANVQRRCGLMSNYF